MTEKFNTIFIVKTSLIFNITNDYLETSSQKIIYISIFLSKTFGKKFGKFFGQI